MANGNGNDLAPDPAMSYSFGDLSPAAASRGQLATGLAPPLSEAFSLPFDASNLSLPDNTAAYTDPNVQSQPSASYVSPRDMASTALTNLAGRMASGFYQDVVKPIGQVFTGELTPSMEPGPNLLSVPEYAGNLALNALGARGMGFAAPEGATAGMFVGPRAFARPGGLDGLRALDDAEYMENAGFSRQDIHQVTGWARNPDGTWGIVLSDEGARLKTGKMNSISNPSPYSGQPDYLTHEIPMPDPMTGEGGLKLKDILEHDKLYEAYPWLKDVNVDPIPHLPGDRIKTRGSYDPVGPGGPTISLAGLQAPDMLSTLLHEIQHAIQFEEGWAKGGNARMFRPKDYDDLLEKATIDNDAVKDIITKAGYDPLEIARALGVGPNVTQAMPHLLHKVMGLPDDVINEFIRTQDTLKKLDDIKRAAYQKYLNLAGEVQARATQAMHLKGEYSKLPEDVGVYEAYSSTGGRTRPYPRAEDQIAYPTEQDRIIMYDGAGNAYSAVPMPDGHNPFAGEKGR